MTKLATGWYAADIISGVYKVDRLAKVAIPLDPASFKASLDSLTLGKGIGAYFGENDLEILAEIEAEYGIEV